MLGETTAVFISLAAGVAPQLRCGPLTVALDQVGALACPSVSVLEVLGQSLSILIGGVVIESIAVRSRGGGRGSIEVGLHVWSSTR